MSMELSVVLPIYKSNILVHDFIKEIYDRLTDLKIDFQIITINDGDKQFKNNYSGCGRVVYLDNILNKGKGFSIKRGFLQAKGNYVAYIDSDGDIEVKSLLDGFLFLTNNLNFDIACGSKFHKDSIVVMSSTRKVMSYLFRFASFLLINSGPKDPQTGLKIFKRDKVSQFINLVENNKFLFDQEFLLYAKKLNLKMIDIPVTLKRSSISTLNFKSVVRAISDLGYLFLKKFRLNSILKARI
jgi:glycosyltransferase involved in cell wall biosynthesis